MMSVDLSSNRFEVDIRNSIGSLSSLVLLNLSHNSFRGHIPAEIAKFQALEELDLSFTWEAVVIGYGCGMIFGLLMGGLVFLLEKTKWYVNFAEDIAQ
ncbi:hypothetical protein KY285_010274 [Solanum tuberosum]|nr:hypothetical protein KY289_012738 [Solanum tuberosum]KAH0734567.1 hypothetical protein KY285_010274 [Solanum tuberosum]